MKRLTMRPKPKQAEAATEAATSDLINLKIGQFR